MVRDRQKVRIIAQKSNIPDYVGKETLNLEKLDDGKSQRCSNHQSVLSGHLQSKKLVETGRGRYDRGVEALMLSPVELE